MTQKSSSTVKRTLLSRLSFSLLVAIILFALYALGKGYLANPTDPEAQWELANNYALEQDYAEAAKWWRKAAEQGYVKSQHSLGIIYDKGDGVEQDKAEAIKWYRLAAEQGYAEAQHNLAVMYDNGEGVEEDNEEAAKWYRLAAEQGDALAQTKLGLMYTTGEGVPQDFTEARKWLSLASEQGAPEAYAALLAIEELSKGK